MKLGMNLAVPSYSQTDFKYGNAMVAGGRWHPPGASTPSYPPLAIGGVPPGYQNFPGLWGYVRPGKYTIKCAGFGSLEFYSKDIPNGRTTLTFANQGESYEFDLKGVAPGFTVLTNDSDAKLALRNLRVMVPGGLETQLYHPDYLSSLKPFAGCYRGMDWLNTNGSQVSTWESRTVREGYGIEGLVALANAQHSDLWINIPVLACSHAGPTDYSKELGIYLAKNLDPSLTCWLEYGNEIWNYGPPFWGATTYVSNEAPLIVDPSTGKPFGFYRPGGYGWMANACFEDVAAQVPAAGPKIKRIFAGCVADYGETLKPLVTVRIPQLKWKVDALACGAYLSWPERGEYTVAAVESLVVDGNISGAVALYCAGLASTIPWLQGWLPTWQAAAKSLGVPLVYYELGLETPGFWNNPALRPCMEAAWTDPRLGALATQHFNAIAPFASFGNIYSHCIGDGWGYLRNIDDAGQSEIWKAAMAWAAAHN